MIILKVYRFLPFVPSGDLVRNSVFGDQVISVSQIITLVVWLIICVLLALNCLNKTNYTNNPTLYINALQ